MQVIYTQVNKDYGYWVERRRVGETQGGCTAGLLTHAENERVAQNILIDCGFGTMDGLTDARGDAFWDEPLAVLITHGHIDHHAELMALSEYYCQRRGKNLFDLRPPLTVYCTQETFAELERVHRFGFGKGNTLAAQIITPASAFALDIFSVTPLASDHFRGAVFFVIAFGAHKILIAWDITSPPRDVLTLAQMQDPSLALVEATTWAAMADLTTHCGFEGLMQQNFFDALHFAYDPARAKYGAYLVHYSGWEDAWGMLTAEQLKQKIDETYPQFTARIRVAARGQQWVWQEGA